MAQPIPDRVYHHLLLAAFSVILIGTFFYHLVEKFSWLDAYYFSVVTLATVGYGDLTPKTPAGKIFTTLYIFAGVGIVTTFLTVSLRRRAEIRVAKREKKSANKRS